MDYTCKMKIGFASDHIGYSLKNELIKHVKSKGYDCIDYGTDNTEKTDYPLYGEKVANEIIKKNIDKGILICGTGIGISVSANKVKGIVAAVCSEPYSAKLSVQHNNADIVAVGSRVVGEELAKMIIDAFLEAEFEGGRHKDRVDMLHRIGANTD